jgi:hypothetical protein
MSKGKLLLIFLILILQSCGLTTSLKLDNIALEVFKKDRIGCKNDRTPMIGELEKQKKKFLGISENEIFYTIGRYDYQTIDKKNEKVFVYFLESGTQCENLRNRTEATCLILKFNSVSLVKEAIIQKGGYE